MQATFYTMKSVILGYKKLHPEAFCPQYATEESACFDLRLCLPAGHREVDVWTHGNVQSKVHAWLENANQPAFLKLQPNDRALLPTQLILDIPKDHSVRLHMRSGLALRGGLILANSEGIIDSDYTQQLMIPVTNASGAVLALRHGDRICQGEIVEKISTIFVQVDDVIDRGTTRNGGFGSTGKA